MEMENEKDKDKGDKGNWCRMKGGFEELRNREDVGNDFWRICR